MKPSFRLLLALYAISLLASFPTKAVSPAIESIEIPKISALEAVTKATDYCKQKKNAGFYADYIITSVAFGRANQLGYAPSQGGSWQVASHQDEASWFVTLRNKHTGDTQILRLMDDGTMGPMSCVET